MLNDWADAQDLYFQVRKEIRQRLFARKAWSVNKPIYSMLGLTLLLMGFGLYAAFHPGWAMGLCYLLLIPWALGLFYSRQWAIRHLYPVHFQTYGLHRQSVWQRDDLLCYVLLLERLRSVGWNAQRAARVATYAESLEAPAKPYLLSQNAVFLGLLGVLTGLSVQAISVSETFARGGLWAAILICIALIYLFWLFYDGLQSPRHRRAYIRRDLHRASLERSFEEPLPTEAPPVADSDIAV